MQPLHIVTDLSLDLTKLKKKNQLDLLEQLRIGLHSSIRVDHFAVVLEIRPHQHPLHISKSDYVRRYVHLGQIGDILIVNVVVYLILSNQYKNISKNTVSNLGESVLERLVSVGCISWRRFTITNS